MVSKRWTRKPAVSTACRNVSAAKRRCPGKPVNAKARESADAASVSLCRYVGATSMPPGRRTRTRLASAASRVGNEMEARSRRTRRRSSPARNATRRCPLVRTARCADPAPADVALELLHHRGRVVGRDELADDRRDRRGDQSGARRDLEHARPCLSRLPSRARASEERDAQACRVLRS
jgi:hypothetical protein